eukprot:m.152122 g.152122  ORF g.152122 m.152122 type:complete len:270 (-) comp17886_c0_seq3:93-902(-)
MAGELNLNIRVPATDRQFLIVVSRDVYVKDIYSTISQVHSKLFDASVKVSFIRNNLGSVIDGDLSMEKVFVDGDMVEACCAPVINAFAGLSDEERASEKRAAEEMDSITHGTKKAKKPKKVKDPNAPKRPVNAFLHFVASKRGGVEAEDNGKELMKKLGLEWHAMTDKQKAPFVQMKDAQKLEYESKMKAIADGIDIMGNAAMPVAAQLPPAGDEASAKEKKVLQALWEKHGRERKNSKAIIGEFNDTFKCSKKWKWAKSQLRAMKLID